MALYRKKKRTTDAAQRAIEARLAGKGYAAIVREAEGLNIPTAKPKRRKRSDWLDYLKTKLKEIRYGSATYAGKKFTPTGRRTLRRRKPAAKKPEKEFKTVRTRTIEKGLRRAGVTEREIQKLRGKK